jgi:hypothetical protein
MMKKILTGLFMFWAGAAQAQIVGTLPFQLQNGTTADATQVMADFNKILNDVNINAAKNGVNTDITALNALVTPITPVQGGSTVYFASTSAGTANAQTVASPSPVGFTLSVGKRVTFIAGFTNTGAMTLNVNGTGATAVNRYTPAGPLALTGGEVVLNNYVEAVYDGTRFVLYTNATGIMTTNYTVLAGAATTDLGTVPSHNVVITGTATITSFGSTAITTYPLYNLIFSGASILTHNGTSLILPGAANITTAANDTAIAAYNGSGNWQLISYSKASGVAVATAVPTVQRFLSGTAATYTTAANVRWIRIRMVGGGAGGGEAGNTALSGAGVASTFSGGTLSAGGGGNAANNTAGGAGGTPSNGNVLSIPGGSGGGSNGATNGTGGNGGNSCLGGGGGGAAGGTLNGLAGATNTGGGGGGGSQSGTSAAGGGAGACIEHIINAPAATYTYTVGTGGVGASGGGAGGGDGGNGAAGIIIVEEHY